MEDTLVSLLIVVVIVLVLSSMFVIALCIAVYALLLRRRRASLDEQQLIQRQEEDSLTTHKLTADTLPIPEQSDFLYQNSLTVPPRAAATSITEEHKPKILATSVPLKAHSVTEQVDPLAKWCAEHTVPQRREDGS